MRVFPAHRTEEAEVQADQKQHEMNRGPSGAQLRRLNSVRANEGDGESREIEIELHSAADEERAREKLAIFPISNREVDRRQSNNDDRGSEIRNHGSLWPYMNNAVAGHQSSTGEHAGHAAGLAAGWKLACLDRLRSLL